MNFLSKHPLALGVAGYLAVAAVWLAVEGAPAWRTLKSEGVEIAASYDAPVPADDELGIIANRVKYLICTTATFEAPPLLKEGDATFLRMVLNPPERPWATPADDLTKVWAQQFDTVDWTRVGFPTAAAAQFAARDWSPRPDALVRQDLIKGAENVWSWEVTPAPTEDGRAAVVLNYAFTVDGRTYDRQSTVFFEPELARSIWTIVGAWLNVVEGIEIVLTALLLPVIALLIKLRRSLRG